MTGTRKVTFEQDQLPGVDDLELDVEYLYEHKPADAVSGEDTNSEIKLVEGWESQVQLAYLKASREAIRKIQLDLVPELEWQNMPKIWSREDANNEQ